MTGAQTRLLRLELHIRPRVTTWHILNQQYQGTDDMVWVLNSRSGRVALQLSSWSITDEEGQPIPMCQLVRPTGSTRIDRASLAHSHWACIDEETFKAVWDKEVAAAEGWLDVETIWVATGLLLPV